MTSLTIESNSPEFFLVQDKNGNWAVIATGTLVPGNNGLGAQPAYEAKTILGLTRKSLADDGRQEGPSATVAFALDGIEYAVWLVKSTSSIAWPGSPAPGEVEGEVEFDYEAEKLKDAVSRCLSDNTSSVFPLARLYERQSQGVKTYSGYTHRPSGFRCGYTEQDPKVDMMVMRHRSGYQVSLEVIHFSWINYAQTPLWRLKTPTTIMWFRLAETERAMRLLRDCASAGADVAAVQNNAPASFLEPPWAYVNLRDFTVFSNTPDLP